ncbi:TPA: hypothetical protein ACGSOM_004166 [Escherichia coli]
MNGDLEKLVDELESFDSSIRTVYENSLAIILTMTLSPSAMLLADFLFKKYN